MYVLRFRSPQRPSPAALQVCPALQLQRLIEARPGKDSANGACCFGFASLLCLPLRCRIPALRDHMPQTKKHSHASSGTFFTPSSTRTLASGVGARFIAAAGLCGPIGRMESCCLASAVLETAACPAVSLKAVLECLHLIRWQRAMEVQSEFRKTTTKARAQVSTTPQTKNMLAGIYAAGKSDRC